MTATASDDDRRRIHSLSIAMHAALAAGAITESDTEFARSLGRQWNERHSLSEKQWPWVDKLTARFQQALNPAAAEPAEVVTFPRLAETFLTAATGLKWPKLRLTTETGQELVLSRCGERSRTPGSINITDGGPYGSNTFFGRINPEGAADLRDVATADVRATLAAYNADPEAEAKVQGQRTGRCMCCGAELTDEVSIALGIGPVCGKRWGISRKGVKAALKASSTTVDADMFIAA